MLSARGKHLEKIVDVTSELLDELNRLDKRFGTLGEHLVAAKLSALGVATQSRIEYTINIFYNLKGIAQKELEKLEDENA